MQTNTETKQSNQRFTRSVSRTFAALQVLAEQDVSSSELAKILGVDRGTARRLLDTVVLNGYATILSETSKYTINANRLLAWTAVLRGRFPWPAIATPFVRELRDSTGETSHVTVLQQSHMVFLIQERSLATVAANPEARTSTPVYSSAVGKAYVAFLPVSELEGLLSTLELKPLTPRTIVSKEALKLHLSKVREMGYAVDDEETEPDMRCIAAPVFGPSGNVVSSIGISGPSTRLSVGRAHEFAPIVVTIAGQLTEALGGSGRPTTSNISDRPIS